MLVDKIYCECCGQYIPINRRKYDCPPQYQKLILEAVDAGEALLLSQASRSGDTVKISITNARVKNRLCLPTFEIFNKIKRHRDCTIWDRYAYALYSENNSYSWKGIREHFFPSKEWRKVDGRSRSYIRLQVKTRIRQRIKDGHNRQVPPA